MGELVGLRTSVGFGTVEESIVAIDPPHSIDYAFSGGPAVLAMQRHSGRAKFEESGNDTTLMTWSMEYETWLPFAAPGLAFDASIPMFVRRLRDECKQFS